MVLAALSVVVVAGSRTVLVPVPAAAPAGKPHGGVASRSGSRAHPLAHVPGTAAGVLMSTTPSGSGTSAPGASAASSPPHGPTSSTPTTTTTTPQTTTTTTTTAPPQVAATSVHSGTLGDGVDSAVVRLGPVRSVLVDVGTGEAVTLEVHCGVVARTVSSTTTARVELEGVATGCSATIEVPSPATSSRWTLVASA